MRTPISLLENKGNKIEQEKANMLDNLKFILGVMPEQLEWQKVQAKALKAKHDSLIKEGFTEEQALEIVKTRPIFE